VNEGGKRGKKLVWGGAGGQNTYRRGPTQVGAQPSKCGRKEDQPQPEAKRGRMLLLKTESLRKERAVGTLAPHGTKREMGESARKREEPEP